MTLIFYFSIRSRSFVLFCCEAERAGGEPGPVTEVRRKVSRWKQKHNQKMSSKQKMSTSPNFNELYKIFFSDLFSFLKTEIFRTPKASLTGKLNVLSQQGFVFFISVFVLKK